MQFYYCTPALYSDNYVFMTQVTKVFLVLRQIILYIVLAAELKNFFKRIETQNFNAHRNNNLLVLLLKSLLAS